jgi:hypothetical protein
MYVYIYMYVCMYAQSNAMDGRASALNHDQGWGWADADGVLKALRTRGLRLMRDAFAEK